MKPSMSETSPSNLEELRYGPDRAFMELVTLIVLHELPFRIVEYEGFKKFGS
jgi:hypothetical protein